MFNLVENFLATTTIRSMTLMDFHHTFSFLFFFLKCTKNSETSDNIKYNQNHINELSQSEGIFLVWCII